VVAVRAVVAVVTVGAATVVTVVTVAAATVVTVVTVSARGIAAFNLAAHEPRCAVLSQLPRVLPRIPPRV
jgi:hypothetical protein